MGGLGDRGFLSSASLGSEPKPSRRGTSKLSWFEDSTVLKAQENETQDVQHEISIFRSLKTIDVNLFVLRCLIY